LVEADVNPTNLIFDPIKAPVHFIEALINPLPEVVKPLVGPTLSHSLHAGRLQR